MRGRTSRMVVFHCLTSKDPSIHSIQQTSHLLIQMVSLECFNSNVAPTTNGFGVVHVPHIVSDIITEHNAGRREGRTLVISNVEINQKNEIRQQITSAYIGSDLQT